MSSDEQSVVNRPTVSLLGPDGQKPQLYGTSADMTAVNGGGHVNRVGVRLLPLSRKSEDEKTKVFVQVVFMKLGEIDTVKETFSADVFIQARWREPKLDGRDTEANKQVDLNGYWNPKLYIHNAFGGLQETVTRSVIYDDEEAYIAERRRAKGTFIENLELFFFPFDTQDFSIKVASERSDVEVELVDDPVNISTINTDMFIDKQEWRLYEEVATTRETIHAIYDGQVAEISAHTAVSCMTHASRRPGFYFSTIFLIAFFVYGLTFTTFAVDYVKRENRLQLTFVLLLTVISYKSVIANWVPRISYMTIMDIYLLFSMIIMIIICIWHAIVTKISVDYSVVAAKSADTIVLICIGTIYGVAHVLFFLAIVIPYVRRHSLCKRKERDHKAKLDAIKDVSRIRKILVRD